MYKRILVPLDGSELAEGVIPYVKQMAKGFRSEVTLFYVVPPSDALPGRAKLVRVPSGTEMAVMDYLAEMQEAVAHEGVTVRRATAEGEPAEEIVLTALGRGFGLLAEEGHDLIAMATHGRSGAGRWLYGSTAERVLRSSAAPLFLFRPGEHEQPQEERPIHTIIVPLDGSEIAECVLPHVAALASSMGLTVALVRAVPPTALAVEPHAYSLSHDEEMGPLASHYLEQKSRGLHGKGVHVTTELLHGSPAESIVDFSARTGGSIIAMAAYGRTGTDPWKVGSVVDQVLKASPCPVLLVRPDEKALREKGYAPVHLHRVP